MSRTKQIAIEGVLDDVDEDQLTGAEEDIVAAVGELEGAEDVRWQVTRIAPVPTGKVGGYCETFTSAEISKELVRKSCGKGRYRIRGLNSRGKFVKQFTIEIANDVPEAPTAPVVSEKNNGMEFWQMLQLMEEKRSRARLEMLTALSPVLAAVLPNLFKSKESSNSLQDMVALSASLKQLMGGDNNQTAMVDMMFKAMEFARDAKGGKEGDSWIDLAKEAVGTLGPALANRFAPVTQFIPPQPHALPGVSHNLPGLSLSDVSLPTSPQENQNMTMLQLIPWAREKLAYLTEKAQQNRDAGLYAEWLLDNAPQGVDITPFIEYLARPDWWNLICGFYSNAAPYQGWFSELRNSLLEIVKDEVEAREKNSLSQHLPMESNEDE